MSWPQDQEQLQSVCGALCMVFLITFGRGMGEADLLSMPQVEIWMMAGRQEALKLDLKGSSKWQASIAERRKTSLAPVVISTDQIAARAESVQGENRSERI